ncbi:MAG: hypothetical protein OHM56_03625 [Spiroplasma phoeniceum]|nr:MAG: hypothetical protein OHM57_03090 [Spiroplasma phoeniceum]UZQ33048.1 MAG: hypothetical protein OHM56_03625 [Spiroplasma phoeniceum]
MTILRWIIIGVFISLLFIFIDFLGWFYQKKQQLFFQIFKQLEVENQEYINNNLSKLTLQEIKVKFKLEPGEKVFRNIAVTVYLQHKLKNNQTDSKYTTPFSNGISIGYGQDKRIKEMYQIPFENGHIFIINQRILIINEDITTTWPLSEINNLELSIFRINNILYQGLYLYTEQKRFMIIVKVLEKPYLIYKVWKHES